MRAFHKKIREILIRPILQVYLKKDRYYTYNDIKVLVKKGVFHPAFFYSTKFILRSTKQFDLKNKTVLELGAGSGLISLCFVKRKAVVTAVDINPSSVEGIHKSAHHNNLQVNAFYSDLFSAIPKQTFDYIIINPPYYRGDAENIEQYAWYAGKNLDYFKKLFSALKDYIHENSVVLMSLSEDCEINKIKDIADGYRFLMKIYKQEKIQGEENYIFEIKRL